MDDSVKTVALCSVRNIVNGHCALISRRMSLFLAGTPQISPTKHSLHPLLIIQCSFLTYNLAHRQVRAFPPGGPESRRIRRHCHPARKLQGYLSS